MLTKPSSDITTADIAPGSYGAIFEALSLARIFSRISEISSSPNSILSIRF